MKVILLNGSPRAEGCTFTALTEIAKILGENAATIGTRLFRGRKQLGVMLEGELI